MAIREIIHAPDDVLSRASEPVGNLKDPEIIALIRDMKDTVLAESGLGLAAPQVGASLRVIVINHDTLPYAIINPVLKWQSVGTSLLEEGCLSLPEYFTKINRPRKVVITGLNEQGETIEINAKDLLAKIFQHEIDHINGILITDRAKN